MDSNQQPQPNNSPAPEAPDSQALEQSHPVQGSELRSSMPSVPGSMQQVWMSREAYERQQAVADKIESNKRSTNLGLLYWLSSLAIGVLILLLVMFHMAPFNELLPTITPDASMGSRYLPASPVIGILYLGVMLLILFQIALGMTALARKPKRPKLRGGKLVALIGVLVAAAIFGGAPLLFAPLLLITLVFCNFTPCAGT